MQLSQRQQKIVERIISGVPSEASRLSSDLGIALRTVYADLKAIKEWAKENGLSLEYSENTIAFEDESAIEKAKELIKDIRPSLMPLNQYSRILLILTLLFVNENGISLKKISNKVGISRATFYRDFPFVKKWLKTFHLKASINKETGAALYGKEENIREAMASLILQSFEHYDVIGLLQQEKQLIYLSSEKKAMLDEYLAVLSPLTVKEIAERLYTMDKDLNSRLSQHMYRHEDSFIIILSAISVSRFQKGHSLKASEVPEIKSGWALMVMRYLTEEFNLSEEEIMYLSSHYQNTRRNYYTQTQEEGSIDSAIAVFLKNMSKRRNYNFLGNDELFQNIRTHLYVSAERRKKGIEESNPLKKMIFERFPDLFMDCKDEIFIFRPFLGEISDDETGYLVMYLAAQMYSESPKKKAYIVCTTGKGSAELLKTNVSRRFPQIEVKGAIHMQEAMALGINDADFILSTTYFYHDYIPVIRITPLLLDEDIEKVKSLLESNEVINDTPPSKGRSEGFFEYMALLSDCANIVQAMGKALGEVDNEVFISLTIHLMMSMQRDDTGPMKKVNPENLRGKEKKIYEVISPLYSKHHKAVLEYDINSIKTYYSHKP